MVGHVSAVHPPTCRWNRARLRREAALNRRAVIALTSVAVLTGLATGCVDHQGPAEEDVLPVVELTYPGASEVDRTWTPEDHDRGVDGQDLSNPALLTRRLRMNELVARDDLFAWYAEQLGDAGWAARPSADNDVTFATTVDDRQHTYRVEAGTPEVDEFTVDYTIGFRQGG